VKIVDRKYETVVKILKRFGEFFTRHSFTIAIFIVVMKKNLTVTALIIFLVITLSVGGWVYLVKNTSVQSIVNSSIKKLVKNNKKNIQTSSSYQSVQGEYLVPVATVYETESAQK
jgi:hypothetical protein